MDNSTHAAAATSSRTRNETDHGATDLVGRIS